VHILRRRQVATVSILSLALAGLVSAAGPAWASPADSSGPASAQFSLPDGVRSACPASASGQAGCAALVNASVPAARAAAARAAVAATTPAGYGPSTLQSAYGLPSAAAGTRQTVAIINAYDDPSAEADLGAYRAQYGLPPCTTADGCFTKVDENGGTNYPAANSGWAYNAAMAMDMISAVCPNCHIMLVEASSGGITDLGTAVNTAVSLGARFVTAEFSTPESSYGSAETGYDSAYFDHPGVAITAPSGNSGYGVSYPAASQYVTAVGGTTLTSASSGIRGWSETAWSGSGAGCSEYEPKPSWQTDTGCSGRTLNDTAAVADPVNSALAVYDSYDETGWLTGGGTAASAAIIAAVYALADTPASGSYPASYLYAHGNLLNDVTSGSDGTCGSYLCTAGTGYDGPTGTGTPGSAIPFTSAGAVTGQITSAIFGKCLDNYDGAATEYNKVDIYTCNNVGTTSQTWTAEADGTIRIAGNCLDIYHSGTVNGTKIDLATCNGTGAQQWLAESDGALLNPESGKCLDDPSSSTTSGTQLDLYTCNQTSAQDWTLPNP
jgi:ricin-type beta-trefoil lectin protein